MRNCLRGNQPLTPTLPPLGGREWLPLYVIVGYVVLYLIDRYISTSLALPFGWKKCIYSLPPSGGRVGVRGYFTAKLFEPIIWPSQKIAT